MCRIALHATSNFYLFLHVFWYFILFFFFIFNSFPSVVNSACVWLFNELCTWLGVPTRYISVDLIFRKKKKEENQKEMFVIAFLNSSYSINVIIFHFEPSLCFIFVHSAFTAYHQLRKLFHWIFFFFSILRFSSHFRYAMPFM